MCDNDHMTEYASPGAVNQHDGALPIRECKRCGAQIVWVTSQRTGRVYPVTVRRGQRDQPYYVGAYMHPQDCADRKVVESAKMDALVAREQEGPEAADAQLAARWAYNAEYAAATTDQERADADARFMAALDAINTRFAHLRTAH
jgi:hypothetical protein